ncbi:MAG: DUF4388 domain-containing protein [Deltaproteobacteria bacterium]|nr:DUF4388 domain-containing protein [Deltaproteobacteria bacterium]MBW2414221.1 DUF4388 domain-containing protein [Deltaproteobacteria bacterium]
MSLQGQLRDFPVADVFQLVAQQRKTGVLRVERQKRKLEICFFEGQVLRARPSESRPDGALAQFALRSGLLSESDLAEAWRTQEDTLEPLPQLLVSQAFVSKEDVESVFRLMSDETLFELFLWDDGRFDFRPGDVEQREGDTLVGAEMMLLDALRMRDEWAQIQSGLPDLSVVVAPSVDIEVFRAHRAAVEATVGMDPEELERIYTLCDGRSSARRVVDLSRLGTFQGARGLVALLREGLLHVEHAAPARVARPLSAGRRAVFGESRQTVSMILLGVILLLAIGLCLLPAPEPRGFPLPSAGVFESRTQTELDRVRAALDAQRWASGTYPESLAELPARWQPLLAPVPLDRYSYSRSGPRYRLYPD